MTEALRLEIVKAVLALPSCDGTAMAYRRFYGDACALLAKRWPGVVKTHHVAWTPVAIAERRVVLSPIFSELGAVDLLGDIARG